MATCLALVATLGGLLVGSASAIPTAFTHRTAFDAAVAALAGVSSHVLTFESLSTGTTIPSGTTVEGSTFTYNFGGVHLQIASRFQTTSGTHYLGTTDAGVLQSGDGFSLAFLQPTAAIGMFFLTADPMVDGDITLTAGGAAARLVAADVLQTSSDGGHVYFLGLIDSTMPFLAATVSSNATCGGCFLYTVDDLVTTIPEPQILALLGTGVVGLVVGRRRARWRTP